MATHVASLRIGRYAAHSTMAAHRHDTPSLSIVVDGSYEETICGRYDIRQSGSVSFCPPDEPHAQRFGRSSVSKLVLTPTPAALDFLSAHVRLNEAPVVQATSISSLGRRMIAEVSIGDAFSSVALDGLFQEVLAVFGRAYASDGAGPARWLREARDFIAAHSCRTLEIAEIAAAVGSDPIRLSRGFRRAFGQTIGQYQRTQRIAAAAQLLSQRRMPLCDIALACGFHDQSHFTRTFKAETGCTPSAYRRGA